MKRFWRKYGILSIAILVLIGAFCLGFFTGRATVPENETPEQVEQNKPAEQDEQPAPPVEIAKEITVTATAYCPCVKCCGKNDGITATGTKATAGRTIAVDPTIIPYGAKVIIDGNTYIAEDCGGAVKGNAVDIFFDSHEAALAFGRKTLVAQIVC